MKIVVMVMSMRIFNVIFRFIINDQVMVMINVIVSVRVSDIVMVMRISNVMISDKVMVRVSVIAMLLFELVLGLYL